MKKKFGKKKLVPKKFGGYSYFIFQISLRPLCNLSMEDAQELLDLTKQNVDWTQVQKEVRKRRGRKMLFLQDIRFFSLSSLV